MIEYLKKWLYINNIEDEKFIEIWTIIVEKNKKPIVLSAKAYVFNHFYDLIKNNISLEDFYMLWDIDSNIDTKIDIFIQNPYDFFDYIKNEKETDKIYIIDSIFKNYLKRDDIFYVL